ncbi:hypothetical protein BDN70DRAFT_885193 [Pholiota conissans]|uniref:Uncharacterized protein n=1 Tax=Pholiota conissans TaxID=109636 RepID=A0A9P5YSX2_9AGAR|nr:hypothetical protein BDN70DRAFT_885193 [Pholiota conissans]
MPGLTQMQCGDDQERDATRMKDRRRSRTGHIQPPRDFDGQYESHSIVSRQVLPTTGYVLYEPQWTGSPPPVIFHRVPLPPLFSRPMALHPLLTPDGPVSLNWTICQNPVYAAHTAGLSREERYHWKALPATSVPNYISLTVMVEPFDTPIVILPATLKDPITIWDVLATIYNAVRRLSLEILHAGSHSPRQGSESPRQVLWTAPASSNSLVNQQPSMGDDGACTFLRTLMNFNTRWEGLVPSPTESDVWILRTKAIFQG